MRHTLLDCEKFRCSNRGGVDGGRQKKICLGGGGLGVDRGLWSSIFQHNILARRSDLLSNQPRTRQRLHDRYRAVFTLISNTKDQGL